MTAYIIERWRQHPTRHMFIAILICMILLPYAHRGTLIAAPTWIIIGFPSIHKIFQSKWTRILFLILVMTITLLLLLYIYHNHTTQLINQILHLVDYHPRHLPQAIQAYIFSIGASVWGTSPILLLAIPGMIRLGQHNQMRYVVAALTLFLCYALVTAIVKQHDWFGGLSWPPRFLIPTVPMIMLCTLPVIQYLILSRRSKLWYISWFGFLLLISYSVWVQFNAVTYWWGEYANLLPPESNGYVSWSGAYNQIVWLPWSVLPRLWHTLPFEFAWIRLQIPWMPLIFAIIICLSMVCAIYLLRSAHAMTRVYLMAVVGLPLLVTITLLVSLIAMFYDDLYLAFSDGLWDSVDLIQRELTDEDIVLISELEYERFFLNYGKITQPRIIGLPNHPGEQPSPEQPARRTSPNPAYLLNDPTVQMVNWLAQSHNRLWVLAESTPFIPWSVRPLERYMALNYYPLRAIDLTGEDGLPVRLIEYITQTHHDPYSLVGPDHESHAVFDMTVRLVGYNLPLGDTYSPNQVIPISLYWITTTALDHNYTVAMHLVNTDNTVAASARDSYPYDGFAPTRTWHVYTPVWDNRAIRLPTTIPVGEYRLWVGLYDVVNGTIQHLSVDDKDQLTNVDDTFAILPITIHIK